MPHPDLRDVKHIFYEDITILSARGKIHAQREKTFASLFAREGYDALLLEKGLSEILVYNLLSLLSLNQLQSQTKVLEK